MFKTQYKLMKKIPSVFCAILVSTTYTNIYARGFDIYQNPYLTEPSLASTFVSQLRSKKIEEMEKLIMGECYQYKNYVNLSIQNWDLAKFKYKSLDEAEKYSQQLTIQIPYQQSSQYTFPFGVGTYIENEKILKDAVLNRTQPLKQRELVDDMYYTCIQMNTQKYFILLNTDTYLKNNNLTYLSASELSKISESSNNKSLLKLNYVPSEKDKLTPKGIGKKINFTEKELGAANALIDEDIKISLSQSDVTWANYKKASRDMQSDFAKFMENGGRNKPFVMIAAFVKTLSESSDNFKGIEIREPKNLSKQFDGLQTKADFEKNIKIILIKFNYQ